MKKRLIMLMFLVGTTVTFAQVEKVDDSEEQYLDQMEQFQEPPAQLDLERRTRIEAQRIQNEKAEKKRAKQAAKEKRKQEARSKRAEGRKQNAEVKE
jgi:hypothetical protein